VIERSAELEVVAQRWANAYMAGDGAALANLVSRDDATLYLGTDPAEVWAGRDVAVVLPQHISDVQEKLSPDFELSSVVAYELGTTGWASITGRAILRGREFRTRAILIFALEHGVWRVVLCENSLPTPNPEVIGVELTRGIEALLDEIGETGEVTIRDAISEGTVALVFTDIVDSTAWLTQLGDDRWAQTVRWHDDAVRSIVEEHGGTVVKTLGDGAMIAFDSTRAAARAARAIQQAVTAAADQPDIEVRIGIHLGEVVRTGEDYLGRAVNKAARIASMASGGEIQVSNSVAALLGDDPEFEFGPPVETVLKGLDGTHQIMSLAWQTEN
jgi:class 3 adenylate cyclase